MNEEQYNKINRKLDNIMFLLTQNMLKGYKTQKDKILFLYSLDHKPSEISEILKTSSNTVRVRLSEARKEGIIK